MPSILRLAPFGLAVVEPEDDADAVADAMLASGYASEFCVSRSFQPAFVATLASAGFIVMAMTTDNAINDSAITDANKAVSQAILLPKLHLERTLLDFSKLHVNRTAGRLLPRYRLVADEGFDQILERCAEVHGEDWLVPELRAAFRVIRAERGGGFARRDGPGRSESPQARMTCFALYRNRTLVAGEFGVTVGRVYTSYSGFRDENSAGTVQLILAARALRDAGFAFWDLGMPMEYKSRLGARSVDRGEFLKRFRAARAARAARVTGAADILGT